MVNDLTGLKLSLLTLSINQFAVVMTGYFYYTGRTTLRVFLEVGST